MTLKERLKEMLKDDAIKERLDALEDKLIELEASIPVYEEFEGEEGEEGEVRITKEIYNEMCEYLEEDEINLMGLT